MCLQPVLDDEGEKEKIPSRAMASCRTKSGGTTMAVAGTLAGIGRGFSPVTTLHDGIDVVLCPPTLGVISIGLGQTIEADIQGAQRSTGKIS